MPPRLHCGTRYSHQMPIITKWQRPFAGCDLSILGRTLISLFGRRFMWAQIWTQWSLVGSQCPQPTTCVARRPRCILVSCLSPSISILLIKASPSPSYCHSAPPLVPRLASLPLYFPQFISHLPKTYRNQQTCSPLQTYSSPHIFCLRLFGSCLSRLS
jgi:hypothetical protein